MEFMINQSIPLIKHFIALVSTSKTSGSLFFVKKLAKSIINELKLKVVKEDYYQFKPIGITYCLILSQSHLIIHTYPENQLIHIDLVVCAKIDKENFKKAVEKFFCHQDNLSIKIKEIKYF